MSETKMVPAYEAKKATVWQGQTPDGEVVFVLTFETPENPPFRVMMSDRMARHVQERLGLLLGRKKRRTDH